VEEFPVETAQLRLQLQWFFATAIDAFASLASELH